VRHLLIKARADPPPQLQRIGGEWLERGESAVLKVPSAIVTEEWSYLLNPLHAAFGKLRLRVAVSSLLWNGRGDRI
jgi:RES domain-containing protein